ncbi:MAG: PLP-dependent aminotransferase family protein [Roseiflexaceae bacterium]
MVITLDRGSPQPLYMQLAEEIRQRIASGALPPGTRLPTVRDLARQLGVTRLTVHNAYGQLQSSGLVEATVGRGTFVAEQPVAAANVWALGQELSARGVLSDMLRMAQLPGMRSLAIADPAPDLYPNREIRRAFEETFASGAALFSYGPPQGDPLLRTVLVDLLRERGVRATPDELVITSGATQGISLIAQTLARPGDTVVVEQPTYLGALNTLGVQGLRVLGVPVDGDGMQIERLESLIRAHRPRFVYTVPTFHNPSGTSMSAERRVALLALCAQHDLPVIEDDIYGLLSYDALHPPALKALDARGIVLYISSLSKSLMPSARIGYIAAAPRFITPLVAARQAHDLCSSLLLQRAMALFIQHGWLAAHLRRTLPRYRERRDTLLDAMARYLPAGIQWTHPRGGFAVWVTLPPGTSVTDLYLAAIERGVAFAPGDVFFAGPAPYPAIRLAFSTVRPDVLAETVQIIGDLLGQHLTRRAFTAVPLGDYAPVV